MNLIIVWYASVPQRMAEFDTCLMANLKLEFIDKIHVLVQDGAKFDYKDPKLVVKNVYGRQTFKTLFDYCSEACKDSICVVSNTDIEYDSTLAKVNDLSWSNRLLAITHILDGKLRNPGCQSTWIFKAPVPSFDYDIAFGIEGCDSFIAQRACEAGVRTENPALSINCWHHHKDELGRITRFKDGLSYWEHKDYKCKELPYCLLSID